MREILFRGKEIDTGKWVYGSLLYSANEDQYFIEKNDSFVLSYSVREETIGQYIGLCDKNGKKIFEGDIVRAHYDGEYERIYQVIFYNGGYKLKSKDCYTVYDYSIHDEHPDFEVIDNVFDNGDLTIEN